MNPLFFSVASQDVAYAETIWERFPSDQTYLYSKNGVEGADLWDEIARAKIPNCKLFVAFWSDNYVKSIGATKELVQAAQLVAQGLIRPLVIRLDSFPIVFSDGMDANLKEVFDALALLLPARASRENMAVADASVLIERVAEELLVNDHPQLARTDVEQTVRKIIQRDKFTCFPVIWLSGYNGVGRQTLVRKLNQNFVPNGRSIVVDVNEASLPQQLVLKIEDLAFGASLDRLHTLRDDESTNKPQALADTIERVFAAGNYVVFRHQRISEEGVELPKWLNDLVGLLQHSNRPKLFIISQLPVSVDRRNSCRDHMADHRISTVVQEQFEEFALQLIGHFDPNPTRWDDDVVRLITTAAGGTPDFLVKLVRQAAGIEDFDKITELTGNETERMGESITAYARWAYQQIEDCESEKKALVFLNDVSPCDADDLAKVVKPDKSIIQVLGKLLDLGLVERDTQGLYRLTPLLSNRLNRDIIKSDLLDWQRDTIQEFVSSAVEVDAGRHEYFKIEARLQAALWADHADIPQGIKSFMSAAHWFQAGIRLYHARHREPAYRILKMAFKQRDSFKDASRMELVRYFGLSCVRNHKYPEADECIRILLGDHRSKDIGIFISAFKLEQENKFIEAANEYEKALESAGTNNYRKEKIYRPLISCILNSPRPDFARAETHALRFVAIKESIFSMMSLARIYLRWWYRGAEAGRDVPDDVWDGYLEWLGRLERDPGVGSAFAEMKAEEEEFKSDFPAALVWMESALLAERRFELRLERWKLMSRSGDATMAKQAVGELEAARTMPEFASNWPAYLSGLTEAYAWAMKVAGSFSQQRLGQFASSLEGKELARIVNKVNRQLGH